MHNSLEENKMSKGLIYSTAKYMVQMGAFFLVSKTAGQLFDAAFDKIDNMRKSK